MVRITVAALCALAGVSLGAPALGQSPESEGLRHVLDSLAAELIDQGRLAGMSVGVTRGPDTLLLASWGSADLEWDVPMPTDAVHEIGSVTKQFTSAAALLLWSEGRLDLDADITEYLPDYDTGGRSLPIRRLFDHTSGIKGYTEMPAFGRIAARALPRDSLVALFEAEPFEFEPGTALIYNNSAYFLLGLIIEKVTGSSYAEVLEREIFPRAGLTHTSYCSNDAVVERRAHGYQFGPDGLERADYLDHTWPYAAGSLCSTVGDLLAWNRALHGGRVLTDEAYAELITPEPLSDGTPLRYAKGVSNHVLPSGHVIEHGGGIPGFLSHSRYYPEHDVTVVVLLNAAAPPGPVAVADAIGEHLFGTAHAPRATPYPGDLARLAGTYRGPARGAEATVRVTVEDGVPVIALPGAPPRPAEHLEGETFFLEGTRFLFEFEDGHATRLRVDQVGGHYVLTRVER